MTERREGTNGYALSAGNALEVLDMAGDELRVLVGAEQSRRVIGPAAGGLEHGVAGGGGDVSVKAGALVD